MFVLDSHCDTPSQIKRLRNLGLDNIRAHVDFPKLKRGGVDGAFFALYVPAAMDETSALAHARSLLNGVIKEIDANPDKVALARSVDEGLANKGRGLTSIFVGLENGSPIGESVERLDEFYDNGVRYVTLCHSRDNAICDSCASLTGRWNGLSAFGKSVVRRMNELGMMVDVSHISDKSFYDVLDCSRVPVVATHSCCRALASHPRNMTDDMIKALADNGGVIQINFCPAFLDDSFNKYLEDSGLGDKADEVESYFIDDPANVLFRKNWIDMLAELERLERPSYKKVIDHLDHAVEIGGIDHVGFGSDFDGIAVTPSGLEDVSCFGILFDEMRRRGYSETDIEKVSGGNFLRVLSKAKL